MKIKLEGGITVKVEDIKKLHKKYKRLFNETLIKSVRPHYSIEFKDDTFMEISKKEYKLLSKYIEEE